jgi:hypothetical protein
VPRVYLSGPAGLGGGACLNPSTAQGSASALRLAQRGECPAAAEAGRGCPAALLRALPTSDASACRTPGSLLSGRHQVSLFRFLAPGLVLACPGLPERPQRR